MATKRFYAGAMGPYDYDDTDTLEDRDMIFPVTTRKAFISNGDAYMEGDLELLGDLDMQGDAEFSGKVGFFGTTPIEQPLTILLPAADVGSLKIAVDAIITKLIALGLIKST